MTVRFTKTVRITRSGIDKLTSRLEFVSVHARLMWLPFHSCGAVKLIHNVAVLVNCPPKIVLPASNLDENFVNKECIAVSLMLAPKSPRILWAKFDTPQPDRLVVDPNTTRGHKILDIAIVQIEAMIELVSVLNDLRQKSVALVHR